MGSKQTASRRPCGSTTESGVDTQCFCKTNPGMGFRPNRELSLYGSLQPIAINRLAPFAVRVAVFRC